MAIKVLVEPIFWDEFLVEFDEPNRRANFARSHERTFSMKSRYALAAAIGFAAIAAPVVQAGISSATTAPTSTLSVLTDATWTLDGTSTPAVPVSPSCLPGYGSGGWTAALAPAQWIWSSACTATDTESHSFSKTFQVNGTVTAASESFAVDNFGTVTINGHLVISALGDGGANFRDVQTADVSAYVHGGTNTIVVTDRNQPNNSAPGWGNPAGVVSNLAVTYQPLPTSTDQCKKDGWIQYQVFKNQGDCVSFVATGGTNLPG